MVNTNIVGIIGNNKDVLRDYLVTRYGYTEIGIGSFVRTEGSTAQEQSSTEEQSSQDKRYVITDICSETELEILKQYNAFTLKVQRDNNDSNSLETKYKILNNGTMDELYKKLDNIITTAMYNKYTKVCDFTNIKIIEQDALYVFDIDETLLTYDGIDKNWWKTRLKTMNNNEELVLSDWLKHIAIHEPKHTHKMSFDDLMSKIGKKNVICLTARKGDVKDITEKHLEQIGVNIPVYYSNGQCKGKALHDILVEYPTVKNVVFIDDSKINLISVNKILAEKRSDIKVYCYLYDFGGTATREQSSLGGNATREQSSLE